MSAFICEKCGRIDNSANHNNYWVAMGNKHKLSENKTIEPHFTDEYFNTHACCAECCKGLGYVDGSEGNYFNGDSIGCISEKTYKEIGLESLKGEVSNWEIIKEQDMNN